MEVAVGIVVLAWVAWFLLLGVAIALAVVLSELLNRTGPPQNPAPTQSLRRIGVEACQAMDRLSEDYLREVQDLFNDQLERR